jgi:hypothetical protein
LADYCGGAGGRARASSPAVSYLVGAAAVAVAVETLGLSAIWADLIAYAAGQTFSPATGCVAPPPEMPNFTDVDVTNILTSNPIAQPTSWGKLADLVHIGAWLTFCECLPPQLITPPAAPIYPANGPVLNPPSVPGLEVGTCWDRATSTNVPFTGLPQGYFDLSPVLLPQSGTPVLCDDFSGHPINAYPIPNGVNHVRLRQTFQPNATAVVVFQTYSGPGDGTVTDRQYLDSGGTFHNAPFDITIPALSPSARYWTISGGNGYPNQTVAETSAVELSYFCTALPGAPLQDCCPPDPIIQAQLQLIINLLNGLHLGTSPPPLTTLVETAVHAGLHDGGTILLAANTIAVRVAITTDNPSLPVGAGVPPYLFSRGFIVPIALEGPIRTNVRLVYNPQLYFLPDLADSIGYQLGVGIIATLTELRAGP